MKKIAYTKLDQKLYAFSISFDEFRGLIGFDFGYHSILIRLYTKEA